MKSTVEEWVLKITKNNYKLFKIYKKMGLFNTTHVHRHETNNYEVSPSKMEVTVNENRSPTDESIKLMEEVHEKAIRNIIAKVDVTENLVNGKCFLIEQPMNIEDLKLIFKFSINGKEFTLEKQVSRYDFYDTNEVFFHHAKAKMLGMAKSVMLIYALKMFTMVVYEDITGEKADDSVIQMATRQIK